MKKLDPIPFKIRVKYWFLKISLEPKWWFHRTLARLGVKVCHHPGCFEFGYFQRQNTAYNDERSNWIQLCPEHHKENDEYWEEKWQEYYRERL